MCVPFVYCTLLESYVWLHVNTQVSVLTRLVEVSWICMWLDSRRDSMHAESSSESWVWLNSKIAAHTMEYRGFFLVRLILQYCDRLELVQSIEKNFWDSVELRSMQVCCCRTQWLFRLIDSVWSDRDGYFIEDKLMNRQSFTRLTDNLINSYYIIPDYESWHWRGCSAMLKRRPG